MLHRVKKHIAALSLVTLSTLGFTGCVIRETRGDGYYRGGVYASGSVRVGNPGYTYVNSYPPDALYEDIPTAPAYGWVWIDGYWNWNGYEWVWIPGHWEAPRAGYVYIQPYYDYDPHYHRHVYVGGYWERNDRVPRGVVVRDHRDGRPPTGYHGERRPAGPARTPGGTTYPTRPGDPAPTRPIRPTQPDTVRPVRPTQPDTQPVRPVRPAQPDTRPVRPTTPTTQPTRPVRPAQPVDTRPVVRPTGPATRPPANTRDPRQPSATTNTQPTRPTTPSGTVKGGTGGTRPAQPARPSRPVNTTQPRKR
jgi:hypothetical protein